MSAPPTTSFEVNVANDTFKFNAAHFVAFEGYRERLHGHNYRVAVRLLGHRTIGADGYVIDFGCIKDACKKVCKRLNEHFLCPMYSNVLHIDTETEPGSVILTYPADGSRFVFPIGDCALLPIVHATTEEMAIYLWDQLLQSLNCDYLVKRKVHTMAVTVAEAPGQEATFTWPIHKDVEALDVRTFVETGKVVPMPCIPEKQREQAAAEGCCAGCKVSKTSFSQELDRIAAAVSDGTLSQHPKLVEDIEKMLKTWRD